jgi:hypothetical protein
MGADRTAGRQIQDTRKALSAASAWSGDLREELYSWYWRGMSPSSEGCQPQEYWEFLAMLKALGLLNERPKSADGDNICSRIEHWDATKKEDGKQVLAIKQWYEVGGVDYKVSFEVAISPGN